MPRPRHHATARPSARSAWARSRVAAHPGQGPAPIISSSRDLVWLDMDPLLKRERERCEEVAAELKRATDALERHRSEWEPAFSRWYHAHFGEKLTLARELEGKIFELERTIWEVEEEALLSGLSERAAYQRILRAREGMQRLDEFRSQPQAPDAALPPEVEELLKLKLDELLGGLHVPKKEYERLFEQFKQDFKDQLQGNGKTGQSRASREDASRESEENDFDPWGSDEPRRSSHERPGAHARKRRSSQARDPDDDLLSSSPPAATSDELRLKQLYRELARKLHPDMNPEQSKRERDLWHEAQSAYETRDLERLETLASMASSSEGSPAGAFSWVRSLSKLKSLFTDLQRRLRSSHKALRQAKKSPAWNFDHSKGQPAKMTEISLQIDWELTDAIASMEEEAARMERRIARWKGASSGAKPRRARQPRQGE
jgi:hypothetical protein